MRPQARRTIERPDSVRRVRPPMTTMPNTVAVHPAIHTFIEVGTWCQVAGATSVVPSTHRQHRKALCASRSKEIPGKTPGWVTSCTTVELPRRTRALGENEGTDRVRLFTVVRGRPPLVCPHEGRQPSAVRFSLSSLRHDHYFNDVLFLGTFIVHVLNK